MKRNYSMMLTIHCDPMPASQYGRYEYPFEIKIPLNIPGKQKHGNQFGSFLTVDYHVEARLHRHGMLGM